MPFKMNRRQFLGTASCAAVGSASLYSTLMNLRMTNTAAAQGLPISPTSANGLAGGSDYKALVCIFLAGGNDSFNMLVPSGNTEYNEYATIRADLALPQGNLIALDADTSDGRQFGVHPSMPEIAQLFNGNDLAFVANVGTLVEPTTLAGIESGLASLPLGLYSHSDQIAHWQTSVPDKRTGFGWGGRTADLLKSLNDSDTISMNISLSGTNLFQTGTTLTEYTAVPWGNGAVQIYGHDDIWWSRHILQNAAIESMLDLEYQNLFDQTFANSTRSAIDGSNLFATAIENVPAFITQFSDNDLSNSLAMVAKTVAAREALGYRRQTFFIMLGGWDHHDEVLSNQVAMLSIVSKAMKEFRDVMVELGVHNQVTTFTASDFGRTLTSNGQGSDHAWGGNHMVMGGSVLGRRIYGDYPALYEDNPLDTGRGRLIPTTACDEYFAEMALWFGVDPSDLSAVFPNIGRFYDTASDEMPLGFLKELAEKVYLPMVMR
ncbi:Protein of unknown function (DUF1501) [hydrothermal vent metagenome]|uniref:DUF1501 domain-containing protein n=1 Tax=hydrothermal vent metagenome TaxID=652676 RepID=A0A3B0VD59_9ZZZZ